MERPQFLLLNLAAAATLLLEGCIYVPPEYYDGPPPLPPGPEPIPTPYYFEGPPPPDDMYFGRRRPRRDYELDLSQRRRGRTEYFREADPDFGRDESIDREGMRPQAAPSDDDAAADSPSPSPTEPSPPPQQQPEKKIDPATVPYATRTSNPGRAKSPYPPYRELDVSGMKSGSMAKDPTTGKVFRVP